MSDTTNAGDSDEYTEVSMEADTSESDGSFDSFIANFEKEQEEEELKNLPEPTVDEPEVEGVVEPEEKPSDGETRGLERIASREKELKEQIAKFETDKKTWEAEKSNSKSFDPNQFAVQMKLYPDKALAALGVDTELVMKTLLYNKLDDSNPAKAKLAVQLKDLENDRRFAEMEQKLAAKDNTLKQKEVYSNLLTGIDEHVKKLSVGSEQLPTVSEVAKADSKYLHEEILAEIMHDAALRYARGETGDEITYDEAAKRLESRYAKLSKLLASKKVGDSPSVEKKELKTQATNSNIKPPPPKAVKKEVTIEDLEERALQNAVIEFKKAKVRGGVTGF